LILHKVRLGVEVLREKDIKRAAVVAHLNPVVAEAILTQATVGKDCCLR
jgi:hypothetical protein